jgi:hypothetical protein
MAETNSITTKRCTKCLIEHAVGFFNRDKNRPDGLFPWCKPCVRGQKKEIYARDREAQKAKRRADYAAKKDEYKARAKKWAAENPEKRKEVVRNYVLRDPQRRYEQQKRERAKNPGYYRAHFKMRQSRKRQALSTWADLEAIEAIYRQCSFVSTFTGIKHHVDHYYPLTSDVVCGLHNQYNLRIIPATENLSKGNNFPEEG